jgi:hypothetical protein
VGVPVPVENRTVVLQAVMMLTAAPMVVGVVGVEEKTAL